VRPALGLKQILFWRGISLDIRHNEDRMLFRGLRAGWHARSEEWPNRFNPVKLSGGDLMKNLLFAAALIAALIPMAAAADHHSNPQADLAREVDVQVPAHAAVLGNPIDREAPKAPPYCKPCLFYAGDMDSANSNTNGLANEFDLIVTSGAAVYAPFIVPTGATWTVTSLFTNNFLSAGVVDPATSPYEVRSKIPTAGGKGGKLVCHGKKKSSAKATGRSDFGFNEYTVQVKSIAGCSLTAGKYWEAVIPYCTNANDSNCTNSYRGFESNTEDTNPPNHVGKLEPASNSFFNSVFFGATWQQATTQNPQDTRFSDGVVGTSK